MITKVNDALLMAYIKATDFIYDLGNDERGLSDVVVAVLLILVGVLAVSTIWGLLSGQLQAWWERIVEESDF